MNSDAFTLGALMAKSAAGLGGIDTAIDAGPVADAGAAVAGGKQFGGVFPAIRNFLMGPRAPKGPLGLAGKLGLGVAAGLGGLGLWNTARTGSPFKHDMGVGVGGMMGSGARSIAQNDPLAQFGGMEPASANYWDQVTMAALQREAQSQNALERIRMLRRLGTGA